MPGAAGAIIVPAPAAHPCQAVTDRSNALLDVTSFPLLECASPHCGPTISFSEPDLLGPQVRERHFNFAALRSSTGCDSGLIGNGARATPEFIRQQEALQSFVSCPGVALGNGGEQRRVVLAKQI
ncbi:MAG TPA: hypothetical protein DHW63_02760 [Hyphomonadaceae bacterium]|nr:hypothetical protein [Hyphomonadaceae bacterium]